MLGTVTTGGRYVTMINADQFTLDLPVSPHVQCCDLIYLVSTRCDFPQIITYSQPSYESLWPVALRRRSTISLEKADFRATYQSLFVGAALIN